MFTGIIQEIGKIQAVEKGGHGVSLTIEAKKTSPKLKVNESIAVNGVCQTILQKEKSLFVVGAVEGTLKKTTLGNLCKGEEVNLELSLRLNDPLGGHLVLGHVDTVGSITSITPRTNSWIFKIHVPKAFWRYIIPVGSIAVDGVSLTVAEFKSSTMAVSIIPHTMRNTTFKNRHVGDKVNIEFDVLGKYIERLLQTDGLLEKRTKHMKY